MAALAACALSLTTAARPFGSPSATAGGAPGRSGQEPGGSNGSGAPSALPAGYRWEVRRTHDLLAHSITLIGVQTSVAAHVLIADPDRLDREAMAKALDGISGTCRDARAELRATLQVLRAGEGGEADGGDGRDGAGSGPPPGLAGLADLAAAAEAAGVRVDLAVDVDESDLSPAVGAAAYRIVQEALTNAVRHAPGTRVRITLARDERGLRVAAVDDGPAGRGMPAAGSEPGYGIVGMRERARSVAGTLTAGPREDAPGFAVTASLPCGKGGSVPSPSMEATA